MMSLMIIGLVSALVGGATFAIFTDSAVNQNNTFTAGTLDIVLNNDTDDEVTSFNVTDIKPGDSGSAIVNVKNNGSLALKYNMTITKNGDLFGGSNPIAITVKNSAGTVLNLADFRDLAVGANEDLTVEWSFPSSAGNEYQGKSGTFDLTFNAEQQ